MSLYAKVPEKMFLYSKEQHVSHNEDNAWINQHKPMYQKAMTKDLLHR